jgi:hypothetical protein
MDLTIDTSNTAVKDDLLFAIELDSIHQTTIPSEPNVKNINSSQARAALSMFNALKRNKCGLQKLMHSHNSDIDAVLSKMAIIVNAYTNSDKVARLRHVDDDTAYESMVSWLTSVVEYFGRNVLLDAEVVLLTISTFGSLQPSERTKYFEATLNKVRKWFKTLSKKLKPFVPPK